MATSIQKLVFMTLYSRARKPPTEELANESRSTHITVAADMVFSLSHYLSGVCFVWPVRSAANPLTHHIDGDRRVCPLSLRRLMGGDSVVRLVATPATVQLAEAGGDFVLQHEPYPFGVVEHVGNPRGAL